MKDNRYYTNDDMQALLSVIHPIYCDKTLNVPLIKKIKTIYIQ